jgi:predicted nuclease of predicted toxin-antitoxin system
VKFLVDALLPPLLAEELRKAGHDAVAVRDVGLREAKDSEIWNYAIQCGAAIVTKDEDFAERCLRRPHAPVVVWLRVGNATNDALLRWFLPLLPAIETRLLASDRLIEIR